MYPAFEGHDFIATDHYTNSGEDETPSSMPILTTVY